MRLAEWCCDSVEAALKHVCAISDSEWEEWRERWENAWEDASNNVMCFMCSHHRLFYKLRTYKSETCEFELTTRASDVLYLLYLKCLMCAFGARLWDEPHLTQLTAPDIPYLTHRGIIRTKLPFSRYTIRAVMDSLLQLDSVWLSLEYDAAIVRYLQLLEYRAAELLCCVQRGHECNVRMYTHDLGEGGSCASTAFLSDVSLYAINMHRSIMVYHAVPTQPRTQLFTLLRIQWGISEAQFEECVSRIESGVNDILRSVSKESMEKSFTRIYLSLSCKPSEVESYLRMSQSGKRTCTYNRMDPSKIMTQCRGTQSCNRTIEASQMSAAQAMAISESVCPLTRPLVILCLLEKAFLGNSSVSFSTLVYYRNYIAYTFNRQHANIDYIRSTSLPLLIQSFNHFSFCWRNVQYKTQTFFEAVACVFIVLAHVQCAKLNNQDISTTFSVIIGQDWKRLLRCLQNQ